MAAKKQIEYAIVGGGISGLTLAIALLERGLSVHIYEQAKQFGEIGAGVSFTPNSLQAMRICHTGIFDAFDKVCTRNQWPSKRDVWFDFYDGLATDENAKAVFTIRNRQGQNAVHRANFLDELVKLMPEGKASFGKRLDDIQKNDDGRYTLKFLDGSSAIADAVLGCDGIKSKTREILFGADHPCVVPSYTFKYAYRAMLPMEKAIAAVGKEKAENACMHVSRGLGFGIDVRWGCANGMIVGPRCPCPHVSGSPRTDDECGYFLHNRPAVAGSAQDDGASYKRGCVARLCRVWANCDEPAPACRPNARDGTYPSFA